MEKFTIPSGFENFTLEGLSDHLCLEDLPANKELVLISAPQTFNVETLIGQQVIENGCRLIESYNNSNSINDNSNNNNNSNNKTMEKVELHSSSTTSDHHLNILLPSKMHDKHCYAGKFVHTVNVLPNIQIPDFASPRKEGLPPPLPRPQGLRTRWKPFGVGGAFFDKQEKWKNGDDNHGCGDTDYTSLYLSPCKRGLKSPRKTHQQVFEEERQEHLAVQQQQPQQEPQLQPQQPQPQPQQQPQQQTQQQQDEQSLHQTHHASEELQQHLEHKGAEVLDSRSYTGDTTLGAMEDCTLAVANGYSDEGLEKRKKGKRTAEVAEEEADMSNNQESKTSEEPQKQKKKKKKKKLVDIEAKENVELSAQVKTECEHDNMLLVNTVFNATDTGVDAKINTGMKKKNKKKKLVDVEAKEHVKQSVQVKTECENEDMLLVNNVLNNNKDTRVDAEIITGTKKKKKKNKVPEDILPLYYIDTVGDTEISKTKKKKKKFEDNVPEQAGHNIEEKKNETEEKTPEPAYYFDTVGATENKKKKKRKKDRETNENETECLSSLPLSNPVPTTCDATISALLTPKGKKKKKKELQDLDEPVVVKVEPVIALLEEKTVISNTHPESGAPNTEGNVKTKRKRKKSTGQSGELHPDNAIKVEIKKEISSPVKIMSESANCAAPTDRTNDANNCAETKTKKKKKKKKTSNEVEAQPSVKVEVDANVPTIETETPRPKKRRKNKNSNNPTAETVDIKIEEPGDTDKTYNEERETKSTIDNHSANGEVKRKKRRKKKKSIDGNISIAIDKSMEDATVIDNKCPEDCTKKKAKKRKRKSDNPLKCSTYLSNDVKKEEPEEEAPQNGRPEDSDMDSDAEAYILGATPRKRICSR